MTRGYLSRSCCYRGIAFTVVFAMAFNASAAGLEPVVSFMAHQGKKLFRQRAPHFTDKPTKVFKGGNPKRDEKRSWWWTPALLQDLGKVQRERSVEQAIEHGEIFASLNPAGSLGLFFQGPGGGGDPGGGGPGGGEGGSPGGGSGGGNPGGGGGGGGVSGMNNTNTGNNLSRLPIVSWPARGAIGVGFMMYHNSKGAYNDVFGYGWTHSYDVRLSYTSGTSAIIHMPDGLEVPYTESSGTFTPPAGWFHTLTHNGGGTWTMTFKNGWKYEFSSAGFLTAVKDRMGNTVTVTRNGSNRITSVSSADGRDLVFAYDSNNRVESVTDPADRVWEYTYDSGGDLTDITYPELSSTLYDRSFTYNSNHDILTETDLRGNVWTWTYDSSERMTSFSNPLSETTGYSYSSTATTITMPGSQTVVHNYSSGLLASAVDQASYSESYTYDSQKNMLTRTDRRGKVWTYTYDSKGNVLTATNPLSKVWTNTYSSGNDLLAATDPLSNVTEYTYDSNGNLLEVEDPLNRASVTNTYDGYGQVLTTEDALARTTEFDYNANGDTTDITDPAGIAQELSYDVLGRLSWREDADDNRTSVTYDEWRRVVQVTNPDESVITATYDRENNMISVTDEIDRTSEREYDAAHRLIGKTNPRGDEEIYEYNSNGWLTDITNGRNYTRSYTHTARGEVASLTLPDSSVEEWSYLADGRTSAYTSPNIYTIGYTYDDAGRQTAVDYPTGTDTSFGYDYSGRQTSMVDSTGTTTWTYDAASQLTELSQPQGDLEYTYNDAGQRTEMTEVGLGDTTYAYDAYGRLSSLTNRFSEQTGFTYNSLGQISRKTFSPGHYEDYTYDDRWRATTITLKNSSNATLRAQSYVYDDASQVTSHTVDSTTTSYTYDDASQLLSESRTGYSGSYTYDDNGNRATRTVGGVTETYSYDSADKLTGVTWSGGSKSYGYDDAGRTISITTGAGTTDLDYDYESRITTITYPNSSTNTFAYNGLDTRVSKVDSIGTSTFKRDGAYVTDPVLTDGTAAYTPGVSERRSSTTTFLHSGLKNADGQSGTSQTLSASKAYDAFGAVAVSAGTWKGPFSYAGEFGYQEDESGLKLLGHRYYDSSTGRFLTRDASKHGRNWFVYCDGNPVCYFDNQGLDKLHVNSAPGLAGQGSHVRIGLEYANGDVVWCGFYPTPPGEGATKKGNGPGYVSADDRPSKASPGTTVTTEISSAQLEMLAKAISKSAQQYQQGTGTEYNVANFNCADWAYSILYSVFTTAPALKKGKAGAMTPAKVRNWVEGWGEDVKDMGTPNLLFNQ